MLEGRILVIENMLRNAVIIEEGSESGIVSVGTTVDVKDDFGKQTLTIVGPAEVDVAEGRISMESPVGKALLGHGVGDTVDVVSPGGARQIKIVKIN
jgi:transcription elongation factor GreA